MVSTRVEPVTVVFTWDVVKGREAEFEEWAHGITAEASRFSGHLGATWLRPEGRDRRYHTVLRFSDGARLGAWLESPERRKWMDRLDGLADEDRTHTTGMETWFSLPDRSVSAPPRWKMVLVTFGAVYPLSLLLQATVVPAAQGLPLPLRGAVFPLLLVPLLTYVIMPGLSRLLRRWLYPTR
ncbi:MAG TPA: antibiotic biosynthesis monooxygenase [Streptosporangiaceae bacterium]